MSNNDGVIELQN